jgi:hypothetical protein
MSQDKNRLISLIGQSLEKNTEGKTPMITDDDGQKNMKNSFLE